MGTDLLRSPRPEVLPPVRPNSVEVPEAGNLLTAGEPATIDASQPQAGAASPVQRTPPADITVHRAGKASGIDEATGLPIVDRSQPSEIPLSARGEDLPPQTATAGAMSPEAEAISARAAESPQAGPSQPELGTPQQGDIQDKLASVGLHGDEANSIMDIYGLDPRAVSVSEGTQDAAGRPWDEQVQDAYSRLADQRGISRRCRHTWRSTELPYGRV